MCSQKKQQTVASDNVSGRLAAISRPKLYTDIEPETGPNNLAQPEALLWLAVIDKAISDFVLPTPDLSPEHRRGLQWFFFENHSTPFNLQYICDMIFDDPSAITVIRQRIHKLSSCDEELKRFAKKRYTLRINSKYF